MPSFVGTQRRTWSGTEQPPETETRLYIGFCSGMLSGHDDGHVLELVCNADRSDDLFLALASGVVFGRAQGFLRQERLDLVEGFPAVARRWPHQELIRELIICDLAGLPVELEPAIQSLGNDSQGHHLAQRTRHGKR